MIAWLKRLWQRRWWRKPEPVEPPASLLTIDMITAKALAVLHHKCNAIAAQYDEEFADGGAKIGSSLRIRRPVHNTVSSDKPTD